ncbi:hypothetical protein BZG36_00476 [Bifiguratus adelaidae]|uniref:Uncharacterized protein n=1 Tax=Bifiguratus adelaidae TaxID=1938954 RepID=A0A261Y7B7_9FUNG|nr:hypothetical protein BZG36_00476 [Bifiguratus adelaidae]
MLHGRTLPPFGQNASQFNTGIFHTTNPPLTGYPRHQRGDGLEDELCFLASEEKVDKHREHWKECARKYDKNDILSDDAGDAHYGNSEEKEDWAKVMQELERAMALDKGDATNPVTNPATDATQTQTFATLVAQKFKS